MEEHIIKTRVYYEDTDFSGIVYHANYLKFFERGRTETLRSLGVSHAELLGLEEALVFTARRITVEYHLPARIDDLLEVRTVFLSARGARIRVTQSIWREGDCIAEAEVEIACITFEGKPRRLPGLIREKLTNTDEA